MEKIILLPENGPDSIYVSEIDEDLNDGVVMVYQVLN